MLQALITYQVVNYQEDSVFQPINCAEHYIQASRSEQLYKNKL